MCIDAAQCPGGERIFCGMGNVGFNVRFNVELDGRAYIGSGAIDVRMDETATNNRQIQIMERA